MNVKTIWRPEMSNGVPTFEEIETLQRALARVDRGQLGYALHPSIPMDTWVGEGEALVAAKVPQYKPNEIEVFLNSREVLIQVAHRGEIPLEQSFTLPFVPDPEAIKVLYDQGVLYIHAVRQM